MTASDFTAFPDRVGAPAFYHLFVHKYVKFGVPGDPNAISMYFWRISEKSRYEKNRNDRADTVS